MLDSLWTILGVALGAIGTWITVRQYVRALKKEWVDKLEAEKQKHADSQLKQYAAERDFKHLERHLEQHKQSIVMLQDELEEMKQNQVEMRTLLNASYNQVQIIAQSLASGHTGGWRPG